ncbi:hypothetical protein BCR34DRAFT_659799 [Clohesyomyces aquaticus]|uniref:Uncharacterized protein n=1 Tax=Clohesyomyces aquaticus TaxID=1231657 RepID=A0A1Y2A9H2_9PLEO|nr:hypothetical protein BCR34DRAFT_659799 [Clohesyomyces aquaticus]
MRARYCSSCVRGLSAPKAKQDRQEQTRIEVQNSWDELRVPPQLGQTPPGPHNRIEMGPPPTSVPQDPKPKVEKVKKTAKVRKWFDIGGNDAKVNGGNQEAPQESQAAAPGPGKGTPPMPGQTKRKNSNSPPDKYVESQNALAQELAQLESTKKIQESEFEDIAQPAQPSTPPPPTKIDSDNETIPRSKLAPPPPPHGVKYSSLLDIAEASKSPQSIHQVASQPHPTSAQFGPVYFDQRPDVQTLKRDSEAAAVENSRLQKEWDKDKDKMRLIESWYQDSRERVSILESEKKSLEFGLAEANRVLATVQNHQAIVTEKQARIRNLETELENLRVDHTRAVKDITRITREKEQLEQDLVQSRATFQTVNNELLDLKAGLNTGITETYIIDQWTVLQGMIENVSRAYFLGRLTRQPGLIVNRPKGSQMETAPRHSPSTLMSLARDHERYTGSKNHRPLIIQAFIWWTLTNQVFDHTEGFSKGLLWAGAFRNALSELEGELRPLRPQESPRNNPNLAKRYELEARAFHKWRSTTAITLMNQRSIKQRAQADDIYGVASSILKEVSTYIVCENMERTKVEKNLREALKDIVLAAVTLDSEIHQHRARIYCEQWTCLGIRTNPVWGFSFRDEEMEWIHGPDPPKKEPRDPAVELVVQPALYREGNPYGEEYWTKKVLCKAKTVVGENPIQPQFRPLY